MRGDVGHDTEERLYQLCSASRLSARTGSHFSSGLVPLDFQAQVKKGTSLPMAPAPCGIDKAP